MIGGRRHELIETGGDLAGSAAQFVVNSRGDQVLAHECLNVEHARRES